MARYSYPSRTSQRGVFRHASRESVQRRRRLSWLRTATEGTTGVGWTVMIDWDGNGFGTIPEDDVTADVLSRSAVTAEYGRDQQRALSPLTSGRATLEVDNPDGDYSPDSTTSPLAGRILPARPLRIQGRLDGRTYTVFRGHYDDYTLRGRMDERSVQIGALDAVARLKDVRISTQLYKGIRTGEAIGHVLDAIGWPPGLRDIDPGVTLIRWWWEEDTDAFSAIEDLVRSEGPPAILYADEQGRIVFRDRHHRLLSENSTTIQAVFDPATDLGFEDLTLDLGWREIINAVSIRVEERDPAGAPETVWESPSLVQVPQNQLVEIVVRLDDPVISASVTGDTAGATINATLVQETGQSLTIQLLATDGDGVVSNLRVTAQPVETRRTFEVEAEDAVSIARYGRRDPLQVQARWVGVHDAAAIADLILGHRAEPLPVTEITMMSGTSETSPKLLQQLSRDLSDRVHLVHGNTAQAHDYFVERFQHRISDGGMLLTTDIGMERAATQPDNVLTFDDPDRGFDNGVFGSPGMDTPDHLLIFDADGRGFDDGVFAT